MPVRLTFVHYLCIVLGLVAVIAVVTAYRRSNVTADNTATTVAPPAQKQRIVPEKYQPELRRIGDGFKTIDEEVKKIDPAILNKVLQLQNQATQLSQQQSTLNIQVRRELEVPFKEDAYWVLESTQIQGQLTWVLNFKDPKAATPTPVPAK